MTLKRYNFLQRKRGKEMERMILKIKGDQGVNLSPNLNLNLNLNQSPNLNRNRRAVPHQKRKY